MKLILLALVFTFFSLSAQQTVNLNNNSYRQNTEIQIINTNASNISLRLKTAFFSLKYHQIAGETAVSLSLNGAVPILKIGAPEVLSISKSVIISDLANMKVKVISSSFVDYQNINLLPSKGNLTRDIDPANVPYVKGQQYLENKFFPENIINLRAPYILRDYRAQTVVFYPFQYNPVTKVLRVYDEIEVEVKKIDDSVVNPFLPQKVNSSIDEDFSEIYQTQFLNYNQNKYTPTQESGNMLIICHQPYMAAMNDFVAWKNRIGRHTKMVSVQSIGNNSDSIKNYISNYYTNHGLTYVLLVGDAQYVTPKMLTASTASDNWYGYLTGNDAYSEVFVGRFSAESVADVQTQVLRTINYELNVDTNDNFYRKNIGIASDQGPGDDNEYDYQHIRNIQTDLLAYNYQTCSELFDGSQGNNDATGNPTQTMVSNELNDGKGSLVYCGHGSATSFGTSGFNNSKVNLLTNAGKLPFIFAVACVNGEFVNQTCFAEAWLRAKNAANQPTGAVATIMSTINQSWNPPMDGEDEMVDILVESYTSNIKRTFAGITINGCMHMNDQYGSNGVEMTNTWNIFGDPSLMLRTNTPAALTVIHQPTVSLGDSSLGIYVNDNKAFVSLSIHDSIVATSYVNLGIATLNFNPISALDTFLIAVTSYNKIPYLGNIYTSSSAQAFIVQSAHSINDSLGNNNQALDYGENVKLNICLKNIGMANGNSLTAILHCSDNQIIINDSSENIGSLNFGDSLNVMNAFSFSISNSVVDQKEIHFTISISDTNGNFWNSPLTIIARAPKLELTAYHFEEISGNANGLPDPGETFKLKLILKNSGHSKIQNVSNILAIISNFISLNQASIILPVLDFDSSTNIEYQFVISPITPLGQRFSFAFTSNSGVYYTTANIPLRVGIVDENYETGDFTKYNWQLGGDKNWIIDDSTFYEGGNSARSGLTSNDDNMNSSMLLTIKVQTNDSISFYKKVSCEDGSSVNQFWDYLEFKIDNQSKGKWQGEIDWSSETFAISSGSHLLNWTYSKDPVASSGSDCAWIDYIVFPPLIDDTKINNTSNSVALNLYPNPADDKIKISIKTTVAANFKLQIFSSTGLLIRTLSDSYFAAGDNNLSLDTKDLAAGLYYISLQSESFKIVRKFIKF